MAGERPAPRIVSFDLMPQDPDYYFVLTEALREFAVRQRADADDCDDAHIKWATAAESALSRIEAAMSEGPQPSPAAETVSSVLGLADEWEQDAALLNAKAERAAAADLPGTAVRYSSRAQARTDCAGELRNRLSDIPKSPPETP